MRLSPAVALALPLLGAAAEQPGIIDLMKQQLQFYCGPFVEKISPYVPIVPSPNTYHAAEAAAAKAAGSNVDILGLDNWKDTLRPETKTYSTGSEEWWVLFTGGNKTCYGLCEQVEKSFNETAGLFAVNPAAPHMAMINCDLQPILCNSWSAGPPQVWVMEIGAPGNKVPIHKISLNSSSTTVKTLTDLHSSESWKEKPLYEGYFHPFDGPLQEFGLAVPLGYVLWVFAIVPSWAMMIFVSFLSRSFMGNRAGGPARTATTPAPAGARVPGARPGDAR
ncbi:MAG: hypothetical protein M1818_005093 [Claussenomyces sp. TS43310]|nr:MAG: hypothetical protein M1818_005093 [Claussenomyces sp. TS43310]